MTETSLALIHYWERLGEELEVSPRHGKTPERGDSISKGLPLEIEIGRDAVTQKEGEARATSEVELFRYCRLTQGF